MFPPYSETFCWTKTASVWQNYTVPSGYRAIVRCVTAANSSGTAALALVIVNAAYIVFASVPVERHTVVGDLRVVAYRGELIRCYTSVENCYVTVSGYLLVDNTAGIRPQQVETPAGEVSALPIAFSGDGF